MLGSVALRRAPFAVSGAERERERENRERFPGGGGGVCPPWQAAVVVSLCAGDEPVVVLWWLANMTKRGGSPLKKICSHVAAGDLSA